MMTRLSISVGLLLLGCGSNGNGPGGADSAVVDSALSADAQLDAIILDANVEASTLDANVSDASTVDASTGDTLADDLRFLREEEKLARDVYTVLGQSSGVMVFDNIARSEQMHTDRVRDLLGARNIPDPVVNDATGEFQATILRELYGQLVARGRMSTAEALQVGATIEDLDIKDITDMELRTRDAEVLAMYASLRCGSRNHLRSFVSQIRSGGASYVPQHISQAEFDSILAGDREQCN